MLTSSATAPTAMRRRVALFGAVVVVLWALSSWLRTLAGDLPALELTGLALASAALLSVLGSPSPRRITAAARSQAWYAWLVIPVGLVGGAGFFFAALEYAPAAQVVVVTYTWPLFFAIASDLFGRRLPAPLTVVALLLGLIGVAIMQGGGELPDARAWFGYACGLMAGLSWVGYSLFVQVYTQPFVRAYPAFLAVGAGLALALQIVMGGVVWQPGLVTIAAAVIMGVGPYGLGFAAWSYVVRNGNPRIVPMLPYLVPGVAAIFLVLLGQTTPTLYLWAGCGVVLVACATVMLQPQSGQRV